MFSDNFNLKCVINNRYFIFDKSHLSVEYGSSDVTGLVPISNLLDIEQISVEGLNNFNIYTYPITIKAHFHNDSIGKVYRSACRYFCGYKNSYENSNVDRKAKFICKINNIDTKFHISSGKIINAYTDEIIALLCVNPVIIDEILKYLPSFTTTDVSFIERLNIVKKIFNSNTKNIYLLLSKKLFTQEYKTMHSKLLEHLPIKNYVNILYVDNILEYMLRNNFKQMTNFSTLTEEQEFLNKDVLDML